MSSVRQAFSKVVIGAYQRYVSDDYNRGNHARCLYHPSCSNYGRQAIEQDGLVRGGVEAFLRMVSCTGNVRSIHEYDFYEALRSRSVHDLAALVDVSSPAVKVALLQLKQLTDKETNLLEKNSNLTSKLRRVRDKRDRILHEKLELRQIDLPHPNPAPAFTRYRLAEHHCEAPSHRASAGLLKGLAIGTCAVVGATLVGAAGAIAIGLLGTAVGPTFGVAAGTGKLHRLHEHISQRYSADAVTGLSELEEPLIGCGQSVHDAVARTTGSRALAATVGGFMGATTGLGAGILSGLIIGGRTGILMGWALGGNIARDLLKVPR